MDRYFKLYVININKELNKVLLDIDRQLEQNGNFETSTLLLDLQFFYLKKLSDIAKPNENSANVTTFLIELTKELKKWEKNDKAEFDTYINKKIKECESLMPVLPAKKDNSELEEKEKSPSDLSKEVEGHLVTLVTKNKKLEDKLEDKKDEKLENKNSKQIRDFISKISSDFLKNIVNNQFEILKPLLSQDITPVHGEKIILAQLMNEIYLDCSKDLRFEIDEFFRTEPFEKLSDELKSPLSELKKIHLAQKIQKTYENNPSVRKGFKDVQKSPDVVLSHQMKIFNYLSGELSKLKEESKETKKESKDTSPIRVDSGQTRRQIMLDLHNSSNTKFFQLFYALTELGMPNHEARIIVSKILNKENDAVTMLFDSIQAELRRGHTSVKDVYQFCISILPMVWAPKADPNYMESTKQQNNILFEKFIENYQFSAKKINENNIIFKKHDGLARVKRLKQEFDNVSNLSGMGGMQQVVIMALFLKYGTLGEITDPDGGKSGTSDDSARIHLAQQFNISKTELDTLRIDQLIQKILDYLPLQAIMQPLLDNLKEGKIDQLESDLPIICTKNEQLIIRSSNCQERAERINWLRERVYSAYTKEVGYKNILKNTGHDEPSETKESKATDLSRLKEHEKHTLVSIFNVAYERADFSIKNNPRVKGLKSELEAAAKEKEKDIEQIKAVYEKFIKAPAPTSCGLRIFSSSAGLSNFQRILSQNYQDATRESDTPRLDM